MAAQNRYTKEFGLSAEAITSIMQSEEIALVGLTHGSNSTYLVEVSTPNQNSHESTTPEPSAVEQTSPDATTSSTAHLAIYKPVSGEQSLHDFPSGLANREVAAFELCRHLGWDLIPPTCVVNGPLGEGSIQRFVPHDPKVTAFELASRPVHREHLEQLICFDFLINNTDRKAGHIIQSTATGFVWAIDNGLSFHQDDKLRTVMWDRSGEAINAAIMDDLQRLDAMKHHIVGLPITAHEKAATKARLRRLLDQKTLPTPEPGDYPPWPWPLV